MFFYEFSWKIRLFFDSDAIILTSYVLNDECSVKNLMEGLKLGQFYIKLPAMFIRRKPIRIKRRAKNIIAMGMLLRFGQRKMRDWYREFTTHECQNLHPVFF